MGLVERRIGLLFAVFLGMIVLAGARAGWLGVVKADSLKSAAATQQKADIVVPARRGTITDVNGTELAVSQPAQTIAATPYLIKDPAAAAAKLATVLRKPEEGILKQLARRDTGFVYVAHGVPARRAQRVQDLSIEGLQFIPEYSRDYPRDWMASQLLGNVGTEGHGLSGLEYRFDRQLRGQDGERRLVRDALGDTIELREVKRTVPGEQVRLTLDANIQDHTEEVLDKVGEEWQPKGATALVMDPNDGVDPGARQLAAGQRQPALRGAGLRDDEPRDRRHLRAGLDVQGVHRRRRARGRQGHARTRRSTSRRSSRSPTARSPTRTRAGGRRCPSRASSRSPRTSAPR